ncbi:uncharacterized protein [Ambystoma mexicanum]|uniref:uncharacterized protein isoform X2 n=1 Tax=Ambystoma mexicanum TaxID=8296 RepID=UPI0037E95717
MVTMEVLQQLSSEPRTMHDKASPANQAGCATENIQGSQRLCRFFSQGRYCQFGKRCRFLHQYADRRHSPGQEYGGVQGPHLSPGSTTKTSAAERSHDGISPNVAEAVLPPVDAPSPAPVKKHRPPKLCRYFANGYCAMDNKCRFRHPDQPLATQPSLEKQPEPPKPRPIVPHPPVSRPSALHEEMRLSDMTPEVARQLRETEITQLGKRFPKDKLIIQEREDGQVTYYRVTVQPTDPDWPFDLKEMDIMVCFSEDYPAEVFSLTIPEDQELRSVMGRHIYQASEEWLQAKFATNQLMGKVELLFRPYLRWLDRNMERLFTEGARLLKRDIDAEKAGFEFVPYQQLQAAALADASQAGNPDTEGKAGIDVQRTDVSSLEEMKELVPHTIAGDGGNEEDSDDSDSWVSCDEDEPMASSSTIGSSVRFVEEDGGPGLRKGTEIRLLDLRLGEGVGTLVAHQITLSLQCSRCKITADLTMSRKHPYTAQCEKCNARIGATFHPSMLHQYSAVLGHLDLRSVAPVDLVLQDCVFVVCCLSCSQEGPLENLSYGQTRDTNCLHCHSKLSVLAEAARFQKISFPRNTIGDPLQRQKKTVRDPAIQAGKPLPERGTCEHFKKSCRWLRFPCCGKAYPCDLCHDKAQNHEMELANRMICGYCAKEQPYSNVKPCISCGSMMTRANQSSHWEGGQGCRNKIKMCRKDKQKYASSSKTISRRSVNLQKK